MDRSGRLAESGPVGAGQVSVPEDEVHVQQLLMLKKIFEVRRGRAWPACLQLRRATPTGQPS
jgi:hypothetical protein